MVIICVFGSYVDGYDQAKSARRGTPFNIIFINIKVYILLTTN